MTGLTQVFIHPSGNGYTEKTGTITGFVLAFLFGPIYFAFKHAWLAAFVSFIGNLIATVMAIGASYESAQNAVLMYCFLQSIISFALCLEEVPKAYRKRGWREVTPS